MVKKMDYQQALDYIFSYMDYEAVPHTPENYDLRRVEELLSLHFPAAPALKMA